MAMYKLPRPYTIPDKLILPTCMYSLPELQSDKLTDGIGINKDISDDSSVDPRIVDLCHRQSALLEQLSHLKNEVEKIKTQFNFPDSIPVPQKRQKIEEVHNIGGEVGNQLTLELDKYPVVHDIVIQAPTTRTPYSLVVLKQWLEACNIPVTAKMHLHSSVPVGVGINKLFGKGDWKKRTTSKVAITLVWRTDIDDLRLITSPLTQTVINGEVNIARYISRLLPAPYNHELLDLNQRTESDQWLDVIHSKLIHGSSRDQGTAVKLATSQLAESDWLIYKYISIADLMLWSGLMQYKGKVPPVMQKWMKKFSNAAGVDVNQISVTHVPASNMYTKDTLLRLLQALRIEADVVEHKEVFTIDAMVPFMKKLDGILAKNLFLTDDKTNLYLLSAKHDRQVDLKDMAKLLGVESLRFANEDMLKDTLGVLQGCVTAYALVNDVNQSVKFICDEVLLQGDTKVYFHPLVNTASVGITTADMRKFLTNCQHEPVLVF